MIRLTGLFFCPKSRFFVLGVFQSIGHCHPGGRARHRPLEETQRVVVEARAPERSAPSQGFQAIREGVRQGSGCAAAHDWDARERKESESHGVRGAPFWYLFILLLLYSL